MCSLCVELFRLNPPKWRCDSLGAASFGPFSAPEGDICPPEEGYHSVGPTPLCRIHMLLRPSPDWPGRLPTSNTAEIAHSVQGLALFSHSPPEEGHCTVGMVVLLHRPDTYLSCVCTFLAISGLQRICYGI